MNKLLLDTNILVYSIDEDSKYFEESQNILRNRSYDLYTTSKNVSEFLVVVTKFPQKSISAKEALEILRDFTGFITIIYPTPSSNILFQEMIEKYQPTGLKILDYEIASISLNHQINRIATFNKKDFQEIEELELYPN